MSATSLPVRPRQTDRLVKVRRGTTVTWYADRLSVAWAPASVVNPSHLCRLNKRRTRCEYVSQLRHNKIDDVLQTWDRKQTLREKEISGHYSQAWRIAFRRPICSNADRSVTIFTGNTNGKLFTGRCFVLSFRSVVLNHLRSRTQDVWARCSVVGWDAMLQAGRSQVRVPMKSQNFFSLPNPSSCTLALGSTQPLTEMSTRKYFCGCKAQTVRKADNRHLWAECLDNMASSTSYNSTGLHGLLQGQLHFALPQM
jgi:hypothetical protein